MSLASRAQVLTRAARCPPLGYGVGGWGCVGVSGPECRSLIKGVDVGSGLVSLHMKATLPFSKELANPRKDSFSKVSKDPRYQSIRKCKRKLLIQIHVQIFRGFFSFLG